MDLIQKNKRVLFLLIVLAAVYFAFVYLDIVSQYFFVRQILKYAGVVICFLTAVITYGNSIRHDDAQLLILGLFFTLIADAMFLFASAFELGVVCFCFVQLCYIRRYRKKSFRRNLFLTLIVLLFCALGAIFGLKLPYASLLAAVYAVLIITAVLLAFRSDLPKTNKRLAQAGMILFLLCDTNVAVSFYSLKISSLYQISSILIWVFYIPSQALLSLSAFNYDKDLNIVKKII